MTIDYYYKSMRTSPVTDNRFIPLFGCVIDIIYGKTVGCSFISLQIGKGFSSIKTVLL